MKVTFDLAARQISIDGDGPELLKLLETVRAVAPQLPNIQIATKGELHAPPALYTGTGPGTGTGVGMVNQDYSPPSIGALQSGQTVRQFVRGLPLDNAAERIAAIAYYIKTHEGRNDFSPKEMDSWFSICGLQKPAQMGVAIFDTKRKYGYIDNGNGRGQWRLTIGGENLVIGKLNQAEVGSSTSES